VAFFLFLLVTATLFLRPAEIMGDLADLPVYEWLILSCLALSLPKVLPQLRPAALRGRPITLCVFGMFAAIALSHLAQLDFWSTRYSSLDFSKVIIYYLLLLANVDSSARLQTFLLWLLACIVGVVVLALLQYHGLIDIPSLAILEETFVDSQTGEVLVIPRLRSTGIYNDPNDLSMLLTLGLMIAAYQMTRSRYALFPLWTATGALLCYALLLTNRD
jgi:putative inorganic carbon (HCO3(-)) transporter